MTNQPHLPNTGQWNNQLEVQFPKKGEPPKPYLLDAFDGWYVVLAYANRTVKRAGPIPTREAAMRYIDDQIEAQVAP